MGRERLVFDTNVLVSSLLTAASAPARALDRAIASGHLLATTATLREIIETLLAPGFDRYVRRDHREALLVRLTPLVEVVEVLQPIKACRDPKDDKFLEAAVNGRGGVIVTGDKDLLELHPFRGIAILRPTDYLRR